MLSELPRYGGWLGLDATVNAVLVTIYDATRSRLLRGRKTLARLIAGELRIRRKEHEELIWVDVGGGTGWFIEQMDEFFPLENFKAIYLIDLTTPLLEVAKNRLQRFPNVVVLQQDATVLALPRGRRPNLITMSYSLSMIPILYPLIDRLQADLLPGGLFGIADFTTSPVSETRKSRRCGWYTRNFWRWWFSWDHVDLDPSKRLYVEHKFDTIKSFSGWNRFLPAIRIPYYVFIGEKAREAECSSSERMGSMDEGYCSAKTTPSIKANPPLEVIPDFALPEAKLKLNLLDAVDPAWSSERMHYTEVPDQLTDFIYSFVWEDPAVDVDCMDMATGDNIFVITSAGDNALHYAVARHPAKIHCIDMNPCQGHLMELKIAAIKALEYNEFWSLFGLGRHEQFQELLDLRLAPHMSSAAYGFWKRRQDFSRGLYKQGYSGWVVCLLSWIFMNKKEVQIMCTTADLIKQEEAWTVLKKVLFNNFVFRTLLNNPVFLWNALGVPINQFKMLCAEGTALEYAKNTFDPVVKTSLLSKDNYHYLLPLQQTYSKSSCPLYLQEASFKKLKKSMSEMVLWTETIVDVLRKMSDTSLDKAVVMDHQDWFDYMEGPFPTSTYLDEEILEFKRVLRAGGEVYWRSAARTPWYADRWRLAGFQVDRLSCRSPDSGRPIDRVNMYASFWRAKN